jgi:hypothetical protein
MCLETVKGMFGKAGNFVTRPQFEPKKAGSESEVLSLQDQAGYSSVKKSRNFHFSFFVGLLGFEPRQTESKSVVLPLHNNPIFPIFIWDGKSKG